MNRTWITPLALAAAIVIPATASAQTGAHGATSHKNLVEVAVEAGSFNTLVTAVKAADLVETLSGKGPFTVFAPNDAAFAKLPAGTIDKLLKDKKQLQGILTLHVLPGTVMAGDVLKAKQLKAETVNGEALDVVVKDGSVYVNGARVIATDVTASNGVIHVIDGVLLPRGKSKPASY